MAGLVDDLKRIPMSAALSETLARAADYARAQSHRAVSLEHLLLALTEDHDAMAVLSASHVDLGLLASDVSAYLGGLTDQIAQTRVDQLGIAPDLKRILEAAAAAANQGKRRDINGAIVLAAIVGDGRSSAAHMLRAQGLTFEEAIRALQKAMSAPSAAPAPKAVMPPMGVPVVAAVALPVAAAIEAEDILAGARARVQTRSVAIAPPPAPPPPAKGVEVYVPPQPPPVVSVDTADRSWPPPVRASVEAHVEPAVPPQPQQTVVVSVDVPTPAATSEPPPRVGPEQFREALAAEMEAFASDPERVVYHNDHVPEVAHPGVVYADVPVAHEVPHVLLTAAPPVVQPLPPPPPTPPPLAPPPLPSLQQIAPVQPIRSRPPVPQPGTRWPAPVAPAWRDHDPVPVALPSVSAPTGSPVSDQPPQFSPGATLPPALPPRAPVALANMPPPVPLHHAGLDQRPALAINDAAQDWHEWPPIEDFQAVARPDQTLHGMAQNWPQPVPVVPGDAERALRNGEGAPYGEDHHAPYWPEQHNDGQSYPWPDGDAGHHSANRHGLPEAEYAPYVPGSAPEWEQMAPPHGDEAANAALTHQHDVPTLQALPSLHQPLFPQAEGGQRPTIQPMQLPGLSPEGPKVKRRRKSDAVTVEQLSQNIPRRMRAGRASIIEVRLPKPDLRLLAEHALTGPADPFLPPSMSVKLRSPDGSCLIDSASPETQWADSQGASIDQDSASWRWTVTPLKSGRRRLHLTVSTRATNTHGAIDERVLPEQVVEVSVRRRYGRMALTLFTWAVLIGAGAAFAIYGGAIYNPAIAAVLKFIK